MLTLCILSHFFLNLHYSIHRVQINPESSNYLHILTYFQLLRYFCKNVSMKWVNVQSNKHYNNIGAPVTLTLTPCTPRAPFLANSTNMLDMFIVVHSYPSRFQRVPTTLVGSQWLLNLLPNQPGLAVGQLRLGLAEDSGTTDSGCKFAWSGRGFKQTHHRELWGCQISIN